MFDPSDVRLDELDPGAPLSEAAAEGFVARTCFKTGPPSRVGVELEWLVYDATHPEQAVQAHRVEAALATSASPADRAAPHPPSARSCPGRSCTGASCTCQYLTGIPASTGIPAPRTSRPSAPPVQPVAPHPSRLRDPGSGPRSAVGPASTTPYRVDLSGRLSTEPGGQLEISSQPAPLAECLVTTAADLALVRRDLAAAGLALVGLGFDPFRRPVRLSNAPRYRAMEQHFDRRGPNGRRMMCSTASVQVCLDAGVDAADIAVRWNAIHALGPVLVALFANSPLAGGRPTGWRDTRQAVWFGIDPSRTGPPADRDRPPPTAYARYALDAEVLAVRRDGPDWSAPAGLTFRGWLRGQAPPDLRPPRLADLEYHLTTLFPPVRAQGHLELRMLDAQPDDGWQVTAAVVSTLIDDPVARDTALAAVEPVAGAWGRAARLAMSDPALARVGLDVVAAALAGMSRAGLPAGVRQAAEQWADRCVSRGRSPADDVLDGWVSGAVPPYLNQAFRPAATGSVARPREATRT